VTPRTRTMCATSTRTGRSTTTTPTTATSGRGSLGGRRDLLPGNGESGALPYKESIALPPRKNSGGEYLAADDFSPNGMKSVSEQPPFSNNTISAFPSLYRAYRKTMLGKREKSAAIRWNTDYIGNIFELQNKLLNRTYKMGRYNIFKVFEPKERDVLSISFEDKILLHSLCDNVLEPLFCKGFINDNYSNQKGKGLHYGLKRLSFFMRSYYLENKAAREEYCRNNNLKMPRINEYDYNQGWIVKCDIKKYFYSIDHSLLMEMIIRKLAKLENRADAAFAFWLCEKVINSTPNPGIPIGNQTSQLFALLFLDGFDHFVKQTLGIKYYGRYMDDFYIIVKTKKEAQDALVKMRDYLTGLKLKLNEKTNIFPLSQGIDFLGFHTYLTPTGRVIRKVRRKSKINMRRKIKKFKKLFIAGKMTLEEIHFSFTSWLAHIAHGNTHRLAQKMNVAFYSEFPELKIKIEEERNVTAIRQFACKRKSKNGDNLRAANTMDH